ncbi:MAG TPA: hypothetical protein VF881_16225 [Polyangiaceae bacterium]
MRTVVTVIVAAALASARPAFADCTPPTHLSTCIDADTFWPHAGPGSFAFIGATETTAPGRFGFGLVATHLARPIVLLVPSADPAGTEVVAVDRLWNATFLFSYGLSERLEAGIALPISVYRTGTGISSIRSQQTTSISHTAMRDVRVGASYALLPRASRSPPQLFGLIARLELALPTGAASSFAGDRSFVAIPALTGDVRLGRVFAAGELGARLRKTTDLLGSRVGPQLVSALGIGADLLESDRLRILLEAIALPTLVEQYELTRAGTPPPLVPAEWQLSVRTAVLMSGDLSLGLGGGGPLTFTGESGITTPNYRFIFSLRYSPLERNAADPGAKISAR